MERKLAVIDGAESLFKNIPNQHRKHFGGWHAVVQFRDIVVEMLMVETVGYLLFKNGFKRFQIEEKTALLVNNAADRNLQQIVVPMPVFVAAFSVGLKVLLFGAVRIEEAVSRVELNASGDIDFAWLLQKVIHKAVLPVMSCVGIC